MKSIDFKAMYFLILYPLAIRTESIAVKVEIVGSSLMIITHTHDLHDFTSLMCNGKCKRIHFKALY